MSLLATAHGLSLSSLLKNPTLVKLIGGVHPVTLSDAKAKARKDGKFQKTILERAGSPTFDMLIELVGRNHWRVYRYASASFTLTEADVHILNVQRSRDVAATVDDMLSGKERLVETRWIDKDGKMMARFEYLTSDEAEVTILHESTSSGHTS